MFMRSPKTTSPRRAFCASARRRCVGGDRGNKGERWAALSAALLPQPACSPSRRPAQGQGEAEGPPALFHVLPGSDSASEVDEMRGDGERRHGGQARHPGVARRHPRHRHRDSPEPKFGGSKRMRAAGAIACRPFLFVAARRAEEVRERQPAVWRCGGRTFATLRGTGCCCARLPARRRRLAGG